MITLGERLSKFARDFMFPSLVNMLFTLAYGQQFPKSC